MDYENASFGEFLSAQLKDKGFSIKKIADVTGIAPGHIENLLRDDFDAMPSSPYLRGYLLRLGKILDFNGDEWWAHLKGRGVVKNSGDADTLPRNRFMKKVPTKWLWTGGGALIVVLYLVFALPHIFGKPSLSITFPMQNPYTSSQNTLTFTGVVQGADTVSLRTANGVQEQIPVAPDGSWQKGVLLGNGPNTFDFSANKFLGGTADITEQIIYEGPSLAATSTGKIPNVHFESTTPATGTYFQ